MAANEDVQVDLNRKPLIIFWDCEAAQSNIFTGDIIEIAARSNPEIRDAAFESLISSSQELAKFTVEKCGIKPADLEGKPTFSEVLRKFFNWLQKTVRKANQKTGHKYFPVLCAHGGYGFDFTMLLSNMKRHKIDQSILKKNNLHFADSFQFCKQLQEDDHAKELFETRLSMDALFSKFCPEKQFLCRHRAMGDVNAMVEIFSTPPFKAAIRNIDYVTSESLCSWFKTQYSAKEQKILLEEKMAKLDAYTKTVNLKKLVQIQLNYEAIERIFEKCCSFMDFYEAMKELGIDRKTAKYFACQFGGMGLKNQGTEPYCSLPKTAVIDDSGLDFSLNDVDVLAKEEFQRAVNVPPLPECQFTIPESSESWDCDLDESRSFTFTVAKPEVPLSLTVDDFVSDLPPKRSKTSKKMNPQRFNENCRPVHGKPNGENTERNLLDMKVEARSETGSKVSMKKPAIDDVFRTGSASLQLGTFPDQKERYDLEKELLAQMNKAMQNEESCLKKDLIPEQSEKRIEESSVDSNPGTEEIIGNDPSVNSDFPGNEEKLNGKETSEKDQTNYKKPKRKFIGKTKINFKGRNKKKIKSSPHTQSSVGSADATVTVIKRNATSPSEENSQDTTLSAEKPEKTEQKSSQDTVSVSTLHDSPRSESSVVGSTTEQIPKTADKCLDDSRQDELKESKPTNDDAHELVKDCRESTRKLLNDLSLTSAGQNRDSKSAIENTPRSEQDRKKNVFKEESNDSKTERHCSGVPSAVIGRGFQPVADSKFKNLRPREANAIAKQVVLNGNLNHKMTCSDSKSSVEQNQRSTSNSNNRLNNSFVSQQQTTGGNTARKEVPSEHGKKNDTDKKLLEEDERVQRKARAIQDGNNASKETTKFCQGKSRQKLQKKAKLNQGKRRHEAVVFVKKSREKKIKDWPKVEIHIGDIPLYVPVEPDLLNDDVSVEVLQDENRSEEKSGKKAESKHVPGCNSGTGNGSIILGDVNLQQGDQTVQIENSVDFVSCAGNESCLSVDVNMREHITGRLHEEQNDLLETQKDQSVDNTIPVGGKKDIQEVIQQSSVGSSNLDQVKNAPGKRQCDIPVVKNEKAESIVSGVLQRPLISEESIVVASSSVKSPTSVAEQYLDESTSIDQYSNSNNLFQRSDDNKLAVSMNIHSTVRKTDSSQQTDSHNAHARQADHEQQTDCALYSTFNNISVNYSDSRMQDKEILTEGSVSYPQSSDTFLLDVDNVSDSYETFPSTIESPSPPSSPAARNDLCLYDTGPFDINTNAYSAGDTGYESPCGVFNISMSPHLEERYPDENTLYPEENTLYLEQNTLYPEQNTLYPEQNTLYPEQNTLYPEENAQYPEERIQYNIPSPEYNRYYYNHQFLRKNNSSQTPFLPQQNVYFNTSSNANVIHQRFLTHPCTHLPPHYPMNPNHIPAPHLYQPRFSTRYIPRYSQSTSNVQPRQYRRSFRFEKR